MTDKLARALGKHGDLAGAGIDTPGGKPAVLAPGNPATDGRERLLRAQQRLHDCNRELRLATDTLLGMARGGPYLPALAQAGQRMTELDALLAGLCARLRANGEG